VASYTWLATLPATGASTGLTSVSANPWRSKPDKIESNVRALAWKPADGAVEIVDIPQPRIENEGQVLVRLIEGGLCGTDREIVRRRRGKVPEGAEYMIMGHETLAEVVEAGKDAVALRPGDRVAIAPRRPCLQCAQCWRGRPDLCETGLYGERGIIGLHGMFAEYVVENAEFVFALPPELYQIGVLMEPASVLAKTLTRVGLARRALFGAERSHRFLVLGAGPIGILAALFATLEDGEVHTVSLEAADSLPAKVLGSAGVVYSQPAGFEARDFDCLIDCTGHPTACFDHLDRLTHNAVVALLGAVPHGTREEVDVGSFLTNTIVKNLVLLGVVNADEASWRRAARNLAAVEERHAGLLASLLTHRFGWQQAPEAFFTRQKDEIKAVIDFAQ
jgi:threonine dehydrogenase-like Zn-dependent dehydrogenase